MKPAYIIGKVTQLHKNSIVLESNWIGYEINVENPNDYEVGRVRKIYFYEKDGKDFGSKKLINTEINDIDKISDIVSTLKTLGYEKEDIEYAISCKEIKSNQSREIADLISSAIKLIASKQENQGVRR